MPDLRARRRVLVALLLAATVLALLPHPASLVEEHRAIDAPIDATLRVPFGAAFFAATEIDLRPGDRLRSVRASDGALQLPRTYADLAAVVAAVPNSSEITLTVLRDRDEREVRVSVATTRGLHTIAPLWPIIVSATLFLLFGCAVAAGSEHPVAAPILACCWCASVAILSDIGLALPWDDGLLGLAQLRPRLGSFALALLPASVLHLAMRFPVVAPSFRAPSAAAAPYVVFSVPAAFGQTRFDDAALANGLERILLSLTLLAASILVIASATRAARMTPIERARTRALTAGVVSGLALPAFLLTAGRLPSGLGGAPLALGLLAIPGCVSWAILRYRLLDPSAWLRTTVVSGIQAAGALLLATLAVANLARSSAIATEAEVAGAVGLLTIVFYEGAKSALRRSGRGRDGAASVRNVLEQATRALASTREREAVIRAVAEIVREHAKPDAIAILRPNLEAPRGELQQDGLALWRSHDAPTHRVVVRRARSEDPSPSRAELVAPIAPTSADVHLLILSARRDGLPFGAEEEEALLALVHVAATALDATATNEELQARVAEKTESIDRALRDRERMLASADRIAGADLATDVLDALLLFVGGHAARARWGPLARAGDVMGSIQLASGENLGLAAPGLEPDRARELRQQVEALCAFGGLAVRRLALLADLKREVEEKAQELAEVRSQRKHADFVRGVAHELRKPTEEVRRLLAELPERPDGDKELLRLRGLSHELGRRLDLLLFHSGIRLRRTRIDLVALVSEALATARRLSPARMFELAPGPPRLPVVADASRLLSVVENLLDNAAKATSTGQRITARVAMEHRGPEGIWARFEIEDEGVGIDADALERIYEPGVTYTPDGIGLGLSLCREIVRLHGGNIAAESTAGRTVFRVTIPQLPEDEEPEP